MYVYPPRGEAKRVEQLNDSIPIYQFLMQSSYPLKNTTHLFILHDGNNTSFSTNTRNNRKRLPKLKS